MKTEPFDLEKALHDPKYEVRTRLGDLVTELKLFTAENAVYPLCGVLGGTVQAWLTDGRFARWEQENDRDLVLVRKLKKVWINVHFDSQTGRIYTTGYYSSQKSADEHKLPTVERLGDRAFEVEVVV